MISEKKSEISTSWRSFTAQRIAEVEHVKGEHHANVVMVKSDQQRLTRIFHEKSARRAETAAMAVPERLFGLMVVLPADRRVDLEKVEQITAAPYGQIARPQIADLAMKVHLVR